MACEYQNTRGQIYKETASDAAKSSYEQRRGSFWLLAFQLSASPG